MNLGLDFALLVRSTPRFDISDSLRQRTMLGFWQQRQQQRGQQTQHSEHRPWTPHRLLCLVAKAALSGSTKSTIVKNKEHNCEKQRA
jgi:hypothetical protein